MTKAPSDPHQVSKLTRFFSSVSTQLQLTMLMLSLVGLAFGVKSYFHVKHSFGIEASQDFLYDLWVQILIAIVVNLISGFLVYKIVTLRIVTLCEAMRKLTEGHYEVEVPYVDKACEIGSMARKVRIFQENGISLKKMERERLDSDKRREQERKQLLARIADDFTNKIKNIVEMVTNSARMLEENCEKMVKSSDNSYNKIQHLNSEAQSASSNVNTVASASEELSASIKSISQEVLKSAIITKEAVRKAEDVKQVVNNLSGSAEKIGSVIGIINDIAEQINLLALNATIEAARAGDAGKGFAVVASEVKNLANQTAKATDEINAIITSMQNETKTSVTSIVDVSTTIGEINNVATVISASISQQTSSTQDIAHNVHSAAEHTNSVSDNMINIASISKENSASAAQMLQSSVKLLDHAKTLGAELDKFISTLRNS